MSTEKVMTMVPEDLALSSDIEYPTDLGTASLPAGAELMRAEAIPPDAVRVSMPYRPELATVGDLVHGGAITSLVDTSAMAAAWSAVEVGQTPRGATVGLTVDFVAPARGAELTADATVRRRGRQLCFCDVDVADGHGGLTARVLVTYKLGGNQ